MGSKTAAMAACLAALLAQGGAVHAADVDVIASTAMREVLDELVPVFERASGHKVAVTFLSGAVLPGKVREGTPRSGPVKCLGERRIGMRAVVFHGPSLPCGLRSITRMLRMPSRIRFQPAVWPHMPAPTTSTSSTRLSSGPARSGTQLAGG